MNVLQDSDIPDLDSDKPIPAESLGALATAPDELLIDDTPVEEAKAEEVQEVAAIERKAQNVLQEQPYSEKRNWDKAADTLYMPGNFDKETDDVLKKTPNVRLLDTPQSRDWANSVREGMDYTTFNETFVPSLEREDADFRQAVELNGQLLEGRQPKFKPVENQSLKGERAVIRVMSYLGLGTLYQTALWHSGFWVTFKAPSETEIIELNRILMSGKVSFGRATYGMAFANTTAFTVDRLTEFVLEHVYDSTLNSDLVGTKGLKSLIATQDIPALLHGFVCTMYPRGFQYRRACVNDPEKCNFVLEETLNLSKLLWVDNASLTDWQKAHMSNRQSKVKDLNSITRYKEELKRSQDQVITCANDAGETLKLTLHTPSIQDYVTSGYRWINGIVDLVEQTLAQEQSDTERNIYVTRHAQATTMRQYAHWVKTIELGSNTIDDLETIESTFNMLSADNAIRNAFNDGVVEFINKSTIAVVGIPVYNCPHCGEEQPGNDQLPAHRNVIPLDVIQLFFGLLTQRLEKLMER